MAQSSARLVMSLLYIEVKYTCDETEDLLVRQVNFYGKEIDFFFIEASMNKISDLSEESKKMDYDPVILNPEKI